MATVQQAISKIRSYAKSEGRQVGRQDLPERDKLILQHAHLVKRIAARLATRLPPSVSSEDLESAGIIGLIDAVEKFDGYELGGRPLRTNEAQDRPQRAPRIPFSGGGGGGGGGYHGQKGRPKPKGSRRNARGKKRSL